MPFTACEFWGRGDPFFGGSADDRDLLVDGSFATGGYHVSQVARFATAEEARAAAEKAPNRRPDARLSIMESRP